MKKNDSDRGEENILEIIRNLKSKRPDQYKELLVSLGEYYRALGDGIEESQKLP